jgi:hypothetical protein
MDRIGIFLLIAAAGIAIFTALSHMSCLVIGESCYRAQLAPSIIIQSAIDGTMIAPIGTTVISALFILCAAYALSATKIITRLPLLTVGIYTISVLCMFRGVSTVPLSFMYPDMVSSFSIMAGIAWFITGLLYLFGFRLTKANFT